MNAELMFHQLSNVMGAIHNLAYMRTVHASGNVSAASIDAVIDMARIDIMNLLESTSEFRLNFNAHTPALRNQAPPARVRVRHVRNQRERHAILAQPAPAPVAHDGGWLDAARPVVIFKPKSKAVKQSELEVVMPDVCGICLEEYTRANSVSTCCGHSFCSACYTAAAEHAAANERRCDRKMKCPMCRKVSPKVTVFRARKTPVRRPRILVQPALVA